MLYLTVILMENFRSFLKLITILYRMAKNIFSVFLYFMKTNNISFTGCDARPLSAILLRDSFANVQYFRLIKELSGIGKKHGFDVFVQDSKKIVNGQNYSLKQAMELPITERENLWLQDNITITPEGKMFGNFFADRLNNLLSKFVKKTLVFRKYHLQGGNFYFINDNGKTSLLIGKEEVALGFPLKQVKQDFGLDKIYPISQPDFHIDLGVRPLKDKVVLVQDDELTLQKLQEIVDKAKKYCQKNKSADAKKIKMFLEMIKDIFQSSMAKKEYRNDKLIAKELTEYGFKVVKVPSNITRLANEADLNQDTHYISNFMNAIVHQNKDGDLVYITNKSDIDSALNDVSPKVKEDIGFDWQNIFKQSVSEYIKPENVYFVDGCGVIPQLIQNCQGGIHCLCSEVPKL